MVGGVIVVVVVAAMMGPTWSMSVRRGGVRGVVPGWQGGRRGGEGEAAGGFITINVHSSRSQVNITANGFEVVGERDPTPRNGPAMSGDERDTAGFKVVVLSQYDGTLLLNRSFNLHKYAQDLGVPPLLAALSPGRVMVIAVKCEAALNMPGGTRRLLQELGSVRAHLLPVRGYLAWVVTTWGATWGEALTHHPEHDHGDFQEHNDLQGTENDDHHLHSRASHRPQDDPDYEFLLPASFSSPVYLEVVVPLVREDCWGEKEGKEGERAAFCRKYEGYGDFCNCHNPTPFAYPEIQLENSVIDDVPLVIVARYRPQELYKCLVTVLRQAGGSRRRVLVVLDGYDTQVVTLLNLLQVEFVIHRQEGMVFASSGTRISIHYRFVLHTVFQAFPNASKAIILEEDVLVAPDFFSYFNQTAWLLDADPSIFCISAWNDLGALHVASHPGRLYRVETHAGYGWMTTRTFFLEVYHQWKRPDEVFDWDIFFRSVETRAGRECVVPDVSRTFHSGLAGIHIKGVLTHAHFAAHPVTAHPALTLHNVHRLTQAAYEEDLYKTLTADNVYFLHNKMHPCSPSYVPRNFTAGPVVIFFSMVSKDHHLGWKKVGGCLGVWNLDPRSHHRGLFRLTFYGTELYIIGYPFSDYSFLKPGWVHVVIEPGPREEFLVGRRTLENRARFRRPELEGWAPYLMVEHRSTEPPEPRGPSWENIPVL